MEKQIVEELTSRLLLEEERLGSNEGEAVALAGTSTNKEKDKLKKKIKY